MTEPAIDMATSSHETRIVSLYRLVGDRSFDDCWEPPADESDAKAFSEAPAAVGDEGLLVYGRRSMTPVEWTSMIERLTGRALPYESAEASAILFVRVDESRYALTFGGGWRLLAGRAIDHDFGLAFALRALDSDEVRRIRRRYFSSKARVDTSVVPSGQALWSFGIREHAELVRQVVGKVRSATRFDLSHLHRATRRTPTGISIDCTDRIRIPLPDSSKHLAADLREVTRVLTECSVDPDLEPLTFIRRVPADEAETLESAWLHLHELIHSYDDEVSLAYPDRYHGGPEISEFAGQIGTHRFRTSELTLSEIREGISGRDAATYLSTLRNGHINGYDDDGVTLGGEVAALHWISAQVDLATGQRLVLLDGDWYELTDRYQGYVVRIVKAAFERRPDWTLPRWNDAPRGKDGRREEKHFNQLAGAQQGFLCLDRKLVYTRMHRHGFEACDVLGPNQELIHVKKVSSRTGSGPLSHLFAQGIVAAENLTDRATWDKFVDLVRQHDPGRAGLLGNRPRAIVYAIHKADGALTPDTLFTFAQSELASAAITLEKLGIPLQILPIA